MVCELLYFFVKIFCVDFFNMNVYIEVYFDRVNIWYVCVNLYMWRSYYRIVLLNGFREGLESCIVLLVLVLG